MRSAYRSLYPPYRRRYMVSKPAPRLALDMYVLAQGVKTGVYRVCDELFPRLTRSSRLDLNPRQVTVIPLAAGPSFHPCEDAAAISAIRAKYGIPADVPYVLSLATLEIRKNLDQVVNAFVLYMEQNEESQMHLVLS